MKLEELMNKVMSTAQQVGTKATEIGKGLLSTTKVNFRLMELNSQVEADYKAAGKLLYAVHGGEEIDPDAIEELMNEIDAKKAEAEALREQLTAARTAPEAPAYDATCPVCGKGVKRDNAYCPTCGTKLDFAEKAEEVKEEATEVCGEAAETVCDKVEQIKEEPAETFEEVGKVVEENAEQAEENFEEIVDELIDEKND